MLKWFVLISVEFYNGMFCPVLHPRKTLITDPSFASCHQYIRETCYVKTASVV